VAGDRRPSFRTLSLSGGLQRFKGFDVGDEVTPVNVVGGAETALMQTLKRAQAATVLVIQESSYRRAVS